MCVCVFVCASVCVHAGMHGHVCMCVCVCLCCMGIWWGGGSPRPQAGRQAVRAIPSITPVIRETTGEPGPFGGLNNNRDVRAGAQEEGPDRPVLRKHFSLSQSVRYRVKEVLSEKNYDSSYLGPELKHSYG